MRKLILVAAFTFLSAAAQAGVTRGLIVASSDNQVDTVEPSKGPEKPADKTVDKAPQPIETPKSTEDSKPSYAARPAGGDATPQAPQPDRARQGPENKGPIVRADRPRRKYESTEARVIYELHRHGIYW